MEERRLQFATANIPTGGYSLTDAGNVLGYNCLIQKPRLKYIDTIFSELNSEVFQYLKSQYNSCVVQLILFFFFGDNSHITSSADIQLKFTTAEQDGFQIVIGSLSEWFTIKDSNVGYRLDVQTRVVSLILNGSVVSNTEGVYNVADTVMGFVHPTHVGFKYPNSEQMDPLFYRCDIVYESE